MNRRPRLLHVITGLSAGGAERALYNLLSSGLATHFECQVLALSNEGTYGERIRALGVPVHALGMTGGLPWPADIHALRSLVRQFQPDCIQGWMYHGNLAAWLAQRLAPERPLLTWNIRHSFHGFVVEKRLSRLVIHANCWLSGAPNIILYNSHVSRQQHAALGIQEGRSTVIPNGFDIYAFSPDPACGLHVRSKLGIPHDAIVIGHVARHHPMKDHRRFVRTVSDIANTHGKVHVLLTGRDVTVENQSLASLVPNPLRARFHWLGERHDVPDLMRAMDFLCLSSAWGEAFPNVLGEAMASGVPCVSTDVGDSAQVVSDTGIIVAPGNDNALYNGLTSMLAREPDSRRALGQRARQRIQRHYGLDAVVEQYIDLYNCVLRSRQVA